MASDLPPLLALTGPTASGKTEVGVELALRLGTEIISADSVQVYRHFDIGSAKPGKETLARVRHHLIDVADPDTEFNVAMYRDLAGETARRLWSAGKLPLVVGGSGLYLRGLTQTLHGGARLGPDVEAELDLVVESEGQTGLYARLQKADPERAARIHPHDAFRTRRALGVYLATGDTMTSLFRENPQKSAFDAVIVALELPRDLLYWRIERRVDLMLAAGWREETARLAAMGYNDTKPMASIGYRTLRQQLAGALGPDEARQAIIKETKAFARRQLTWLRSAKAAVTVTVKEDDIPDEIARRILAGDQVGRFLTRHGVRVRP